MRAVFILRSPDGYDPLQIFLQETGSQEISVLVCELVLVELSCLAMLHISCLSYHRLRSVCHKNQFHFHHLGLDVMHQCCCHGPPHNPVGMLHEGCPHPTESSSSHSGGNDEDIMCCFLFIQSFFSCSLFCLVVFLSYGRLVSHQLFLRIVFS